MRRLGGSEGQSDGHSPAMNVTREDGRRLKQSTPRGSATLRTPLLGEKPTYTRSELEPLGLKRTLI